MDASYTKLENRKQSLVSPAEISCAFGDAIACGIRLYMTVCRLDLVCGIADRVLPAVISDEEVMMMKNERRCPKCQSKNIVRVPDNPYRHASGSNIYTTTRTLIGKIPVIRYVCCNCGYVENWVENQQELEKIKNTWG